MWNKLGLVLLLVLAIVAVVVNRQQAGSAGSEPRARLEFERSATRVTLREISPDGRQPMLVTAEKVTESTTKQLLLENFSLVREQGTRISGRLAEYDLARGLVKIRDKVVIRRGPTDEIRLDGLVWDRKAASGRTDRPVDLRQADSTIRADRAEFENDFNDIHFIGGVHAKIAIDQLELGL